MSRPPTPAEVLAPRYERFTDFIAPANRLDLKGKFRSALLERHIVG